jgi:hypothetical protein
MLCPTRAPLYRLGCRLYTHIPTASTLNLSLSLVLHQEYLTIRTYFFSIPSTGRCGWLTKLKGSKTSLRSEQFPTACAFPSLMSVKIRVFASGRLTCVLRFELTAQRSPSRFPPKYSHTKTFTNYRVYHNFQIPRPWMLG